MTKKKYIVTQQEALAEVLRGLREISGYSQKEIANTLGISRSTYAYYELAKTLPSIFTLHKISEIFGVSLEEVIEASHSADPVF